MSGFGGLGNSNPFANVTSNDPIFGSKDKNEVKSTLNPDAKAFVPSGKSFRRLRKPIF